MRAGEGPGAVDVGGHVRGPSGDPRRLGAGDGHGQQPLVLPGLDGDRKRLVQRAHAVPPAAGGERAGDGQGTDLGDRRHVRVPQHVSQVLVRRGVVALFGQ